MLKLKDIVKKYYVGDQTVDALKGISLNFRKNEFVSILGPSGCGKTTTLNIIGGLDQYTSGDLVINGVSTKDFKDHDWDVYRNHRIGFIFQSYNLIPHQTVLGNVELALTISGVSKQERIERAKKALDRVGLAGQYKKHPNQLSGGQCQRVAIARALVNEPDILLADEPTGALDTETSVQIMDLIKEISHEKLVIMVTHNPDLAYKYSTRIVKFIDGEIIDDSNPFSDEDETKEVLTLKEEEEKKIQAELNEIPEEDIKARNEYKKNINSKEKAKMSMWTAFKLSARNLWSKMKRTVMVGIAGSIGIIGVATVLSVSTGVRDYINNMQDDLLSGNPITVSESSIDMSILMNSSSLRTKFDALTSSDHVNVKKIIDYLLNNQTELMAITKRNEFNQEYVNYVKSMPKEYYQAIALDYGIEIRNNLYTDYVIGTDSEAERERNGVYSLTSINSIYSAAITHLDDNYEEYGDVITSLTTPIDQCVPNNDYILTQYDVLAGKMPEEQNDLVLVLDENNALSDLVLAQLGYYSQEQFYSLVYNSLKTNVDKALYKDQFTFDEILNKKFYWYPNDDVFSLVTSDGMVKKFKYNYRYGVVDGDQDTFKEEDKVTLNIVGIVKPKSGISYGALTPGLLYQEDFARYMITKNIDSTISRLIKAVGGTIVNPLLKEKYLKLTEQMAIPAIANFINGCETIDEVRAGAKAYGYDIYEKSGDEYIPSTSWDKDDLEKYYFYQKIDISVTYDLDYYWEKLDKTEFDSYIANKDKEGFDPDTNIAKVYGVDTVQLYVTEVSALSQIMKIIPGLSDALGNSNGTLSLSAVGGETLPKSISIYPNNFDDKDLVTNYLDAWNKDDKSVTVKKFEVKDNVTYYNVVKDASGNEVTYTIEAGDSSRGQVKYSDNVGLIIGMINQMIDIVTYALIAFTALSLVVSSVMIAIITYVSVMERIKEIGVIRSLGGRKKDVSHLFNAETFIIGLASGVIGIVVTGIICILANLIVGVLSNGMVTSIAHLTPLIAVIMVLVSVLLTAISGLIPARSAAKKDPVVALRTE